MLQELRNAFHQNVFTNIIRTKPSASGEDYPNFSDISSPKSVYFARQIAGMIANNAPLIQGTLPGQTTGREFERAVSEFLEDCFQLLHSVRPGNWIFGSERISDFEQYEHLSYLSEIRQNDPVLATVLESGYIITPDIVISRTPLDDNVINQIEVVLGEGCEIAQLTPLRTQNNQRKLLHASISCKWTIRSDRSQNTRTEALNLIRNRKGHTPHIVAVTAGPLPTRLASLALGTGDLDCVYHFALYELKDAVQNSQDVDQLELLNTMIQGKRLRDISDLPFDLVI